MSTAIPDTDANDFPYIDVIQQIIPAPPSPRYWLVFFHRDEEGWFSAWSEPVPYLALIERRYGTRQAGAPPGVAGTREHLVEPLTYSIDTLSFVPPSSLPTEVAMMLPEDVLWEVLMEYAEMAIRMEDARVQARRRRALA
jgi:hypothetical protein